MQICVYFLLLFIFFTISGGKCLRLVWGEMTFLPCTILWKFVGYMYARDASVDMDMNMDMDGKFHIHDLTLPQWPGTIFG